MGISKYNSMDEVLFYGIQDIINNGMSVSPRGIETIETLHYSFMLENPRARLINIKSRKWNYAYALGELCWHLRGSDRLNDIFYYSKVWSGFSKDAKTIRASCYGNKIFKKNETRESIWTEIVELLKRDPETRRAVITLNNNEDLFGNDVSCVISIQFLIRNNKINCIANMRSNDIIWGMCYDVFFITFLQELLALELRCDLGWYVHNAASMHLYRRHLDMAYNILKEGVPIEINSMKPINNPKFLEKYLETEEKLREGYEITNYELDLFPEYWRNLTYPLIQKSKVYHSSN